MNIVGFNFSKIAAERKRSVVGKVNISNNIHLREITEAKIGIGDGDRQAVKVSFQFRSEYTPNMALLQMDGDVLMLLEKKLAKELLKSWKDSKHIPQPITARLMNHILDRCNIQGLLMAKDLNLPSPVPLPKVNMQTKKPAKAKPKKKAKKKK